MAETQKHMKKRLQLANELRKLGRFLAFDEDRAVLARAIMFIEDGRL